MSKRHNRAINDFFQAKRSKNESSLDTRVSEPDANKVDQMVCDISSIAIIPGEQPHEPIPDEVVAPVNNEQEKIIGDPTVVGLSLLPDVPFQPRDAIFPKRAYGNRQRSFQQTWFDQFKWLHYVKDSDSVLCHTCATAEKQTLLKNVPYIDPKFISKGYTNWKKALENFRDHQKSKCHIISTEMINLPKQCKDIGELCNEQLATQRQTNRQMLAKILQNVQFLSRQELPLQGDDAKDSNFLQLLILRSKDDENLMTWIDKKTDKYTSHDIQNEILDIMASNVMRQVGAEIKQAGMYSILADECSDISNREQLTICLRWIDEKLTPHEEFIGYYEIPTTGAEMIVSVIKDALVRMDIPLLDCRGQCYDGAGNMAGCKSGVARRIQDEIPTAYLTHCHGHALSLAVHDMSKRSASSLLSHVMDTSHEICKLIKFSPKRQAFLERIKGDMKTDAPGIKVLCPTRWTVRAESFSRILENFDALNSLWRECLESKLDTETRARILGVQSQMRSFDFFYGLNLAQRLFSITDNLSKTLQGSRMCAAQGQHIAQLTMETIQKMRNDSDFESFFALINQRRENLETEIPEPKLPRKKKVPKKLESGKAPPYHPPSVEEHYRQIFFKSIDDVVMGIKERFDQPGFKINKAMEDCILKCVREEEVAEVIETLKKSHLKDINFDRLSGQLPMLPTFVCGHELRCFSDIYKFFQDFDPSIRDLFSEIEKIIRLILVNPATDAIGERSFSTMRRIKTWLRSTMKQRRLNSLAILNVHKERTDSLDLVSIGDEFTALNENRRRLFGKFTALDFAKKLN